MKTRMITYLTITSLFCGFSFGDQVMLTTEEIRLDFQLQSLQWKKTLSVEEKQKIVSALASKKDPVVRSALKAIGVHRVKEAIPTLNKGIGVSDVDLNQFAKLIVDAINSNNSLDEQMEQTDFPDKVNEKDRKKVKEYVNQTEVVRETKSRRKGLKTKDRFKKLKLTKLQKHLLKDAGKKQDLAINEMISTLSTAEIAGADQYDLVTVLRTYDPNSVQAVIQKVSNEGQVQHMSLYGKILLLGFLDISIYTMPKEGRGQCKMVFEQFINDEQKVARRALWALEHLKQLESLESSKAKK